MKKYYGPLLSEEEYMKVIKENGVFAQREKERKKKEKAEAKKKQTEEDKI